MIYNKDWVCITLPPQVGGFFIPKTATFSIRDFLKLSHATNYKKYLYLSVNKNKKLKIARILKDLTQRELSAISGVPVHRITLIEAGYVEAYRDEVINLSKALNSTPKALFGVDIDES